MKYIKTYESVNLKKFVDKLEKFFNEIKLNKHAVGRYKNTVQIYYGKYGQFTYEDYMFYENDGEKNYPFLDHYISSKIPNSDPDYINPDTIPNNITFSVEEYEFFKTAKKYNL